jgi:hypothetical protein
VCGLQLGSSVGDFGATMGAGKVVAVGTTLGIGAGAVDSSVVG